MKEEDREEGEVRIYDEEAYLVTGGELFEYHTDSSAKINWRQVNEFDQLMFQHNPYAAQHVDPAAVAEQHILQNLEQIAFTNFKDDRNGQWLSLEGQQVLKTMQCGMQYYMFAQKHITNKVLALNNYLT